MSEDKQKSEYERGKFEGLVLQKLDDINREMKEGRDRSDRKHTELKEEFHGIAKTLETKVQNNENRIAKLEQWRWWLIKKFGVVAFIVTFVANILANKL